MVFIGGMSDQDAVLLNDFVSEVNYSQKTEFPVVDCGESSVIPVEMVGTRSRVNSESVVRLAFFRI